MCSKQQGVLPGYEEEAAKTRLELEGARGHVFTAWLHASDEDKVLLEAIREHLYMLEVKYADLVFPDKSKGGS